MRVHGLSLAAALAALVLLGAGSTRTVPGASAQGDTQGDVTCDSAVNSVDSLQILRHVAGLGPSAGCLAGAGDVNCDSAVNSVDALRILRYVAGLPLVTPDGCAPIGDPLEPPPTSEELISAALDAGDITYEESLRYRAYALYDLPGLPEAFRSPVIDMEAATQLFGEIEQKRAQLSEGLLDDLAPIMARPADPTSIFNNPPARVASLSAAPSPTWRSRVVDSTNARVWVKDTSDDPLAGYATEVARVWPKLQQVFGLPRADKVTDPPAEMNPDTRIDIYFVNVAEVDPRDPGCTQYCTLEGANGMASETDSEADSTSSAYVMIRNTLSGDDLLKVIAHELAHAVQYTYDYREDFWLMDSTADWAAFRVLDLLGTATRSNLYRRAEIILDHPNKSLSRDEGESRYAAWLYFFFASMDNGDAIVKSVWQKAAASGRQGITAADQALPFADHFADFALRNVNLKPPLLKAYKDKDDTFPAYQPREEEIEIIAPGTDPVPAALAPLSARYYAISPLEPTVRTIRFDNNAYLTPDLHIWALVQIKGEWQEPEDWTAIAKKEYCRDDPEQDVTRIILVVSNSSMTLPTAPSQDPLISSFSAGCNGWAGTMTATETWTGYNGSQTGKATTTFSGRWDITDANITGCPVADPLNDPPCVTYVPTGAISWTWESHNSSFPVCDETRAGSLPAGPVLFPDDQVLQFVPLKLGTIQYYKYWGHSNWRIDEQLQCAGPEGSHQPPNFFEISASEDPQPADPGGNTCFLADRLYLGFEPTLTGSCYEYNFLPPTFHQHSLQYQWNLHAVGNPTGP